jgi:hypothetical protein
VQPDGVWLRPKERPGQKAQALPKTRAIGSAANQPEKKVEDYERQKNELK